MNEHSDRDRSERPAEQPMVCPTEAHDISLCGTVPHDPASCADIGCEICWDLARANAADLATEPHAPAAAGADPAQRATQAQVEAVQRALESFGAHGPCGFAQAAADAVVAAAASPGTPEPSGAVTEAHSGEERVAKWREALRKAHGYRYAEIIADGLVSAVMAVADAEQAELRAEVDDLSSRLSALLCDLTRGRLSKTNYDVRTMVQAVEEAFEEDGAEAEARAEAAEAKVARVEALAEAMEAGGRRAASQQKQWGRTLGRAQELIASEIRVALAGPTEPDTTESGE